MAILVMIPISGVLATSSDVVALVIAGLVATVPLANVIYASDAYDSGYGTELYVNWDLFKNCALNTEWFLKERNLYGGHIMKNSSKEGFHSFIYELELFNLNVGIYNCETYTKNRIEIKNKIDNDWKPDGFRYKKCISFLDEVIRHANEFVRSKKTTI
jgi:hypothetical protein